MMIGTFSNDNDFIKKIEGKYEQKVILLKNNKNLLSKVTHIVFDMDNETDGSLAEAHHLKEYPRSFKTKLVGACKKYEKWYRYLPLDEHIFV